MSIPPEVFDIGKVLVGGIVGSKPLAKLVEVVSAGIGTLYKPKAMRNEAEAKAYELEVMSRAEAKSSIIKLEVEQDIASRVRSRLYHQEISRQHNLDNIIDNSIIYLNEEVSEDPIDDDWRTRFFNKAQDIKSEEVQKIWSKILANEINTPGTVSLRTLDVLSNVSMSDAKLFTKLCKLSTINGHVLKYNLGFENFDLSYDEILHLMDAGLLLNETNIYSDSDDFKLVTINGKSGLLLEWHKLKLFITKGYLTPVLFFTSLINKNKKIYFFPSIVLTIAGKELLPFIGDSVDLEYISRVKISLKKIGYKVQEIN
ncbi:DUF2806 domain-containing protein [Mucilaginibacter sp. FT3.2]|uniref:DUF2806 domain-containing protein n=1 Tax=Mucilaginibacter sp. FT3.2 TaxID=2723090 RepID=UPI00161A3A16|nr:DUF2806 domain-containing protein [Mucilaginibacter sp. FT3.2]MBB6233584.1 hypothetical protein [Mucilaginibacter sp. FT3.2]